MILPMLRWWLGIELIGLLALPLTTWIFRAVPGRGLAWSKALGLLIVGYGAWLLVMLGFATFGTGSILLATAGLTALSWQASRQLSWAEVRESISRHWRRWLAYELVFALALVGGVLLRLYGAYGSAIRHTEKPMELMLLNAVLTSPAFPPQDLWLAGYSINYYYLGYVFVAVLKVVSNVTLGEAFNLGVATIFALSALGITGMISTLLGLTRRFDQPEQAAGRWSTALTCGLALLLILGVGNQYGALQRMVGSSQVNRLENGQLLRVISQALQGITPRTLDPATVKSDEGSGAASSTLPPMSVFDWWSPSRGIYDDVMPMTVTVDGVAREGIFQGQVITEFPFFSFYLGDLHPHVLALPWVILVLALSLALLASPTLPAWSGGGWLELGVGSLALGSLYMLNSWDAPTYGLIYISALGLLHWRLKPDSWRTAGLTFGLQLAGVLGCAILLFAPFLLTFVSFAGQTSVPEPWSRVPILRTVGKIIGPARDHTSWSELIALFGLFLVPLIAWWGRQIQTRSGWALVGGLVGAGLIFNLPLLAFFPLSALLFREARRRSDPKASHPAQALVCLISAVGTLLLAVTDWIYLRDNFDQRFNTVFKVYFQVWLVLGLAAAYACWAVLRQGGWRRLMTIAWLPAFGLLLIGGAVYPVTAISPATNPGSTDVPRVLDGLEFHRLHTPGLLEAAAWVQANTPTGARLAASKGGSYGHGGALAALTGRPTLLAWPGSHENLWRSKQPLALAQVQNRPAALAIIYTAADPAQNPQIVSEIREILKSNKLNYVVAGPDERLDFPGTDFPALAQATSLVYDAQGWRIYQVQP